MSKITLSVLDSDLLAFCIHSPDEALRQLRSRSINSVLFKTHRLFFVVVCAKTHSFIWLFLAAYIQHLSLTYNFFGKNHQDLPELLHLSRAFFCHHIPPNKATPCSNQQYSPASKNTLQIYIIFIYQQFLIFLYLILIH